MSFFTPITQINMQDVLDWTIANNKDDYTNPVRKCSERYDHRALRDIPADLDAFHKRFPLKGYKPGLGRTENAAQGPGCHQGRHWPTGRRAGTTGTTGRLGGSD